MTAYSSDVEASALGTNPAASNSAPRCTSSVASPPSSRIMFGPPPSGQRRTCSVHHQYSSSVSPFQAYTGTPCGGVGRAVGPDRDGGGGVVLGGVDVARGPADLGAELDEGLDEHGRLDGHVQGAGDPGSRQRLARAELGAHRHEAGHLVLGEADLVAAELSQGQVGDLEVGGRFRGQGARLRHGAPRCGAARVRRAGCHGGGRPANGTRLRWFACGTGLAGGASAARPAQRHRLSRRPRRSGEEPRHRWARSRRRLGIRGSPSGQGCGLSPQGSRAGCRAR